VELAIFKRINMDFTIRSLFADLILYFHFLYILGVLLPIPLIVIGYFKNWRFIRNLWFRRIHLGMIFFVVIEALLGIVCPLTEWEAALRAMDGSSNPYPEGFIAGWISKIIFFSLDPWVFTLIYLLVAGIVLGLYFFVPPEKTHLRLKPNQ